MTAVPILEPLRAEPRRAALLFDVDGTLAPIVDDPASASVPAPTAEVLAELAGRYRLVACVTGRPALAARAMVGLAELTYAGNHGLELLRPGEERPSFDPGLADRPGAVAGFIAGLDRERLARAGIELEDKGPIQALHWRRAADSRTAEQLAAEIAAAAEGAGLVPHRGRMVLELRPLASVDKGVATRRLVVDSGATAAMFAGDDRTDLDAFAALRALRAEGALRAAACVGIDSAEAPPELAREADLMVAGPAAFLDVLRSV